MRLLWIAIGLGIIGLQFLLSSFKNPYLGGIIPFIYIIATIYIALHFDIFSNTSDSLYYLLFVTIGFIILMAEWVSGRNKFSEKQNKELRKMKSKDI
ncbi:hypothetical protein [Marinococcus sp. PL1-022]|uniref:hypothetical protein n=1 Tax=Marinococcus sp. PL1-022 TaxID=3095363 RepID=UPI0029C467C8|nr:hypothetical protein [Marinococcus sp. PL1-022]MDX6154473.1 hypothetical protein [Marinococcus sp. PL1-022]